MSPEEIVINIQNQLLSMINEKTDQHQAKGLIIMLNQMSITPDELTRTGVATTVNRFRKLCQNRKLTKFSKSLVKRWKRKLSKNESLRKYYKKDQNPREESETGEQRNCSNRIEPSLLASSSSSSSSANVRFRDFSEIENQTNDTQSTIKMVSIDYTSPLPTDFRWRKFWRDSLIKTLKTADGNGDFPSAERLAYQLENCIYSEFQNTGNRYKNKIKSIRFNLSDPKNPQLRRNFITGAITPAQLAKMSVEEMANDEMKALRKKFNDESLRQLIRS